MVHGFCDTWSNRDRVRERTAALDRAQITMHHRFARKGLDGSVILRSLPCYQKSIDAQSHCPDIYVVDVIAVAVHSCRLALTP